MHFAKFIENTFVLCISASFIVGCTKSSNLGGKFIINSDPQSTSGSGSGTNSVDDKNPPVGEDLSAALVISKPSSYGTGTALHASAMGAPGTPQYVTNQTDTQSRFKATTIGDFFYTCLLYTSPSPRDATLSRMPSSA